MRGLLCCLLLLPCLSMPALAAHAYAQFGDVKYPPGFAHFDYVNPAAPKGGEISLVPPTRLSNFDKYNPFTLKGSAPPGLAGLVFETLLTGTFDEPTTAYGLLAEDVAVAPDRLSVVFRLHPAARFHNGEPVLAADVKHSFDRLTSKEAAPQFRTIFGEVKGATVLDARTVRFDFKRVNAELPLIVGGLPVFSRHWGMENGKPKPLDQIVTDLPIGSGPYRIAKVNFGKDISYQRDPDYWARDLNVRRGLYNFDRITYKIYKDNTAQLEAFKAGEFDYIQAFIAREWARAYTGRAFERGELIKQELAHGNAGDFQGFQFNLRRDKFKDRRVREAIGLAMDFEWLNRQLFYNAYTRVRGYFVASDFEAKGLPGADELALLEPLRSQLPAALFTQPVPLPPVTRLEPDSGQTLRDHLRRARQLLAEAGWTYRDGALRNARGEPFTIEFLDNSGSMGRVVTPFAKNLEKLGIAVNYKVIDFAILQKRMDVFDFEVVSNRTVGSEAPGTELLERFGSRAADTEGSANIMGVKDPAVDALLDGIISARTRPELVAGVRALDRVLRFGHYVVPHWYGGVHRVAWRAGRFERPDVTPRYYQPEVWITSTWWASEANRKGMK
ncbi:extracellular solute-binding protein [Ramlibacter sp. 2FC]|uniref:extracellular solute-binding protein n=1 Tax=Ramlibacter sp. 2FC TaxID=2502188 RepID=UPI0010F5353A|nr:extracellular solute-binding protein [Ramlibacter sp. 2FC]